MYQKGFINGKLYLNGAFVSSNLYLKEGKVATISSERLPCDEVVDLKGRWLLPGFIDPHVHFHLGVGANVNEDDFKSGSQKALMGGITTYIDFLDPVRSPDEVAGAFESRLKLAAQSYTDYAFHGTVANPKGEAEDMIRNFEHYGITSVKLFTTYSDTERRTYDGYIWGLLTASAQRGTKILVHAENDDLITANHKTRLEDHEASRPVVCETTEVLKLAEMAKLSGGKLYIVHVSSGSTVEKLRGLYLEALEQGNITLESCPHYFVFNSELYRSELGHLYTMTPPLRPEAERQRLLQSLKWIRTIGTDHCPYPEHKKKHALTSEIPMGIGGVQYSFLEMFTQFGDVIIDKFTINPSMAFGLYPMKGHILPGADADLVIFNPDAKTKVDDCSSVYHGREMKGAIEQVYLRGNCAVASGIVYPSQGAYIPRRID